MELAYLLVHGLVNFLAWHFFQSSGTMADKSIVLPWMKTTVVPQWGFAVKKLWKRKLRKGQRGEMITNAKKKKKLGFLPEIISAIVSSRNSIFTLLKEFPAWQFIILLLFSLVIIAAGLMGFWIHQARCVIEAAHPYSWSSSCPLVPCNSNLRAVGRCLEQFLFLAHL